MTHTSLVESAVPFDRRPVVMWVSNAPTAIAGATPDDELIYRLWDCAILLSTALAREPGNEHFPLSQTLDADAFDASVTARWVCESMGNYTWVYDVARELAREFERRIGAPHVAWLGHIQAFPRRPERFPADADARTMRPQDVPQEFQRLDTINAYRDWYAALLADADRHPHYTSINPPAWLKGRGVSPIHIVDAPTVGDDDATEVGA